MDWYCLDPKLTAVAVVLLAAGVAASAAFGLGKRALHLNEAPGGDPHGPTVAAVFLAIATLACVVAAAVMLWNMPRPGP